MLSYPADMAELADAPDLGSGVERRAGSSPVIRIFYKAWKPYDPDFPLRGDISQRDFASPSAHPGLFVEA